MNALVAVDQLGDGQVAGDRAERVGVLSRQLGSAANPGDHLAQRLFGRRVEIRIDAKRDQVRRRLGEAFNHPDPDQGLTNARRLAGELDKTYPDAAASIREGLQDMFTVRRLEKGL